MSRLEELMTRARFNARRRVAPYPGLFMPLIRRRVAHDGHVVDDSSEIMIEGFPRSGNTFAVAAFELAQGRPVAIARHLHAPAHVIEGVRRRLPVLIVVRDPVAAVGSLVIRHPGVTIADGLREYIAFHRHLVPWKDGIFFASFPRVTSDFGSLIPDLNCRFGTDFAPFEHSDANLAAVYQRLDEMDTGDRTRRAGEPEATVARPQHARQAAKAGLEPEFQRASTAGLVAKARRAASALIDLES